MKSVSSFSSIDVFTLVRKRGVICADDFTYTRIETWNVSSRRFLQFSNQAPTFFIVNRANVCKYKTINLMFDLLGFNGTQGS